MTSGLDAATRVCANLNSEAAGGRNQRAAPRLSWPAAQVAVVLVGDFRGDQCRDLLSVRTRKRSGRQILQPVRRVLQSDLRELLAQ